MAYSEIKISVDNSDVAPKVQDSINKFKTLGDVAKKVTHDLKAALTGIKDIKDFDEAFARLNQLSSNNITEINKLIAKINELKDASDKAFEEKQYKKANSYAEQARELEQLVQVRQAAQKEIGAYGDALLKEQKELEEATKNQVSFRTELMKTMNEYRQMTMAMQQGKAVDPQRYEEVRNKLVEMRAAMAKMNHEMQILASQTPTLSGLIAAARGVTGVFSVAQGVLGVFNTKSEDMQKIMMRVQSLMAVMMGLQQLQTTLLQKDAILLTTVGRLKKWWTGITTAATAATTAEAAATGGLTTAIKALGLAIKSIPAIGWIIAGITAVVAAITRLTKSSREAGKAVEDMFNKIAEGSAEGITQINELENQWKTIKFSPLKDDWLKDAIEKFQKLGYAIHSVKDAEELLSDPSRVETLRRAEMAKAQAEAARALIVEETKKQLQSKLLVEGYMAAYNNSGWWSRNFGSGAKALYKAGNAVEDYNSATANLKRLFGWESSANTQFTELLNTLGIGTYTGGKITNKGGKGKLATAEEIAREFNSFVDSALDSVDEHISKRQSDLRKSMTNAMADGLEKTLQKLQDEQLEAQERLDDWWDGFNDKAVAKLRDLYKKRYGKDAPMGEAANSDANWQSMLKSWFTSDAYKRGFTEYLAGQAQITDAYNKAVVQARKTEAEKEAADMLKSLTMQEEYEKKKLEITKKYEKLIAAAKYNGDEALAKKFAQQGKNEVNTLTAEYNKEQAELFKSVSDRSSKSLKEQLKNLKDRLKTVKEEQGSWEQIKELKEKINDVEDALDEKDEIRLSSLKEIINSYAKIYKLNLQIEKEQEKLDDAIDNGETEEADRIKEKIERLKKRIESIKEGMGSKWLQAVVGIAGGLQLAAQYAQEIAQITGENKFSDWAEGANAVAQNLNSAAQGYQMTGNWVGAVIGGLIDIGVQSAKTFAKARAWSAEFQESMKEFRRQLKLSSLEFDSSKFEDMFGTRSLQAAAEAYKRSQTLLREYKKLIDARVTLRMEDMWESKTSKRHNEEYKKGMKELQTMQILVKKYDAWGKMHFKKNKYQSLFDIAPEIWGGKIDGEFNVEAAEKFLETNKKITDEQRRQIQEVIDLKKAYDEAIEAIDGIISDTVGSFADDMADAVWESLVTEGTTAWDIFQEKGNEALVALGKQMLKEFAINTYLENFKEKLRAAYGSGDMNTIAQVYTEIFDGIPMVLENMTIAGQQWIKMLKDNGYDVTTQGASSGSMGGYTTQMSHEDASEINGRMTDIQMQMRLVQSNVSQLVAIQEESRGFARMQADYLYQIRTYTSSLPMIAEYSKKIATNTANL